MPTIASLTSFTASTRIKAAEVNSNFSAIRTTLNTYGLFTDVNATVSAVYTFNTAPVFATAQAFAAAVTVQAGGLTVTAGGLTVTAGGLTVSAGGAGITGLITGSAGATITGTVTATTFSGSGASLTNLPAANLTGTIAAISGVNLTNLNGSNIASGTVSASYLPTSYTALTITTATVTTGVVQALQGAAASPRHKINLAESAAFLLEITSASPFYSGGVGSAAPFMDAGGASLLNGPSGFSTVNGARWLKCNLGGADYWIAAVSFS